MSAETNGPEPRLKQIFADALERKSAAERDQYLAEACGGDATLRAQVEALLKAHAQAGEFLGLTLMGEPGEPLAESPGTVIGHYKLLEKIGEGGFGSVYVADQEEPVRRRVALKIIKLGMDTRQVVARFEAERQALAMMDHPNIAKVYDAGSTESGRPYFVMELVRGTRITEYCDRQRLDPEHRLRLFVQVCHAIQHAHQKGIIHRDLKPSNILVAMHDAMPVPKVIDFGIAKATEGRLTDKTLYTAWEQFIGTPAYISPEQAKLSAVDVDTRSDIYSLGVLLYELLTGRTPFDQKELLQAGVDAMRRTIQEVEPVRPSTRLSALDKGELDTVAAARGAEAPRLIGLLHGDLDWIVMKCLEKDRTRRYETADGLVQELERHLAHEPVQARPPSVLYQVRKWARRHRVAFAAGSAVATALAVTAVISVLWGLSEQANSRQLQDAAAREQARSRQIQETAALYSLRQGQTLAENGSPARGMHWMVNAMDILTEGNQELERTIAESLAAWSERLVNPERTLGHFAEIDAAAFSPDGRWVATVGGDAGGLKLWSAATGRLALRGILPAGANGIIDFTFADGHGGICFSPDGTRLLTGGTEIAQLWSVRTGERVGVPMKHNGGACRGTVAFSPDGRLVLTGHDRDGTVRLWSGETGESVFPPMQHGGEVRAAAFSPDGELVISGGDDGRLRLWSSETGRSAGIPLTHGEPVLCVAFSPDGKLVASGGWRRIRLWYVTTHEQAGPPMWHDDHVHALAFSADGTRLLSGSADHTARLWSVTDGSPIGKAMRHKGAVMDVSFSPDAKRVLTASADGTARLWTAENGESYGLPMWHEGHIGVSYARFSPTGVRLLTVPAGKLGQIAMLWSDQSQPLGVVKLDSGVADAIAFSPNSGRQIVTGNRAGEVKIWSAEKGYGLENELQVGHRVLTLAYSPDGLRLLVGGESSLARVWDTRTWKPSGIDLPHQTIVRAGRFSPDGRWIATVTDDVSARYWGPFPKDPTVGGIVRVWSGLNGDLLVGPLEHPERVNGVAFSPDSSWLVTACDDNFTRVWTLPSGKECSIVCGHSDAIRAVAVSPDGRLIATASKDRRVRIWDAKTRTPTGTVLWHEGIVDDVTFSPDGRWLLTAGEMGHARIWSVATGEPIGPVFPSRMEVRQAAFSPDVTCLATVGLAGADVWKLPPPLLDPLPDLKRWRAWVPVITRMDMGLDGVVRPTWGDVLVQRLDELGGPPVSQRVRSDERSAGSK